MTTVHEREPGDASHSQQMLDRVNATSQRCTSSLLMGEREGWSRTLILLTYSNNRYIVVVVGTVDLWIILRLERVALISGGALTTSRHQLGIRLYGRQDKLGKPLWTTMLISCIGRGCASFRQICPCHCHFSPLSILRYEG